MIILGIFFFQDELLTRYVITASMEVVPS